MDLTLMCGGPGAPLTAVAFDAVRSAVEAGRSVALCLPTLPDVRRARLALCGTRSIGVSVRELDAFIRAQWEIFGDGRRIVTDVQRRALISQAWRSSHGADPGEGLQRILTMLVSHRGDRRAVRMLGSDSIAASLVAGVLGYDALLDAADLIEASEAALRVADRSQPPAQLVVVHRFASLDDGQSAVLKAWSAAVPVLVTLPWDPGIPSTASVGGLVDDLTAAGAAITRIEQDASGSDELDAIRTRLFTTPGVAVSGGAVRLTAADGSDGEAAAIASSIQEAVGEGIPAERIAVAFRDPARHLSPLRRALASASIQADLDVSLTADRTPFGRSLCALWAFGSRGEREDLGAFLRSPFSGLTAEENDRIDEAWRGSRPVQRMGILAHVPARARRTVVAAVRLAGQRPDARIVKKWQALLDDLYAAGHAERLDSEQARVDAGVHGKFMSAIEALAAVGAESCDGAFAGLARTRIAPAPGERCGRVQVMDLERLSTRRFDVVILGGVDASELPRVSSAEMLEGEPVRHAMRAFGIDADPEKERERERTLFAQVLARARKRVVVVRRATDDEGREVRRSMFWDELLDLFDGDAVTADATSGTADSGTPSAMECGRRTAAGRGLLEDPEVIASMSGVSSVSTSAIETYLGCPYAWFVERVLRPRTPDEVVDARTGGSLAHAALASVQEEVMRSWPEGRITLPRTGEALAIGRSAVDRLLEGAPAALSLEEQQTYRFVRRAVAGMIERDATFLPGYRPALTEWQFDAELVEGCRITGRIDRVDEGPEGLVVIDYKSGRTPGFGSFEKERKVQLQLYALAVRASTGRPVAGALYRSLSRGADRGFVLDAVSGDRLSSRDAVDEAGVERLLEAALEAARDAVRGMRAGVITPDPTGGRCGFCAAAGFCPEARS